MRFTKVAIQTVALLLSVFVGTSVFAQSLMPSTGGGSSEPTVAELPDPLTPEAANALISRLSDSEVRALLLDQLNTQTVDEEVSAAGLSEFIYHATSGAGDNVLEAVRRLPLAFSKQGEAFVNFANFFGGTGLLYLFAALGAVIATAAVAELLFRQVARPWLKLPKQMNADASIRETVSLLFKRLMGQVGAVLVFFVVAGIMTHNVIPELYRPFIAVVVPMLIVLPRMAGAISRFLMAPDNPAYRFVHTDDRTAKTIAFHMFWLTFLIGFTFFVLAFNAANGVPAGETRIGFWLNLSVHVYLALIIWRNREGLIMMMRGSEPDVSPIEERIAQAFPIFGLAVTFGTWWVVNIVSSYGNFALLLTLPHYKTMIFLLFAPALDTLIRGLVHHLSPPMTGEGPIAARAYYAAKRSYIRIGRVIVFGLVLMIIGRFWGMTPGGLASAGVGERLAANMIEFLMIISVGYIVYELVSLYINRKLAQEQTSAGFDPETEDTGDGGGAGGSRLSTVLPLILGVSQAAIVILFVLLALSNVGVDTTPLLAGAGIVGLAIGFGAQKLVSDVVSGIFFLIDDAFRTGEYVDVNGTMGTVEKISIRSMQLRHHKGPVHTLPYGEIPKITNFSRDWVIMKLIFTVPFGTDPEKVRKLFKKIGQDLLQHEIYGDDFLQPFKSQGVFQFDDVGIVIRGKFMAKPGTQFTIRKEIYNRVNAAFAENGIEFARREVRVALPNSDGDDKLTDDEKRAIAGAAAQASQEQAAAAPAGDKPGD
ncbi:MAG: mechanosensitive ion channel domain-containing protein [Tateyamaria sp.]|uniref:mechanosensitive ion channel domain-containing protein n=2 Tax=Tateyamaria sp. TaxID=1929288 RepID=UPI003296012D